MNTTLPKSPNTDKDVTAELPAVTEPAKASYTVLDTPIAAYTITEFYAVYITTGKLEAGLRKRTLLDERHFRQLMRQAGVLGRLEEFAHELGYSAELVDDELTQFLYHSSQIKKAVGVEYADYTDDWPTIKRKFAAYISTPGIDDLWGEINKAINNLDRNPDPITAPGVVTSDPK